VRVTTRRQLVRVLRKAAATGQQVTTTPADRPGTVRLDLTAFDQTAVAPAARSVSVGAGVTWEQLVARTEPHELAVLPGAHLGAAAVADTLAGALGPVARTFGLAADHVLSIDLVTADGTSSTVTPSSDPDLFCALRGGAAGLGVVTGVSLGLLALRSLRAGTWWFAPAAADDVAAVVHRWRTWVADLPESTSTRALLVATHAGLVLGLQFAHVGDPDEGAALLAELADDVPTPRRNTVAALRHPGVSRRLREGGPTGPRARGTLFESFPSEAVGALVAAVGAASDGTAVELRLRGGAIARASPVPGCVPGRDATFSLRALARSQHEADAVVDALTPWTTGGTTLDLGDPRDARAAEALRTAWGEQSYERLTRLRRELDPAGVMLAPWEPDPR
jgi:FAD/FMN-containing dehydrogenase